MVADIRKMMRNCRMLHKLKDAVISVLYNNSLKNMKHYASTYKTDGRVCVVFIVQYTPAWNQINQLYEELKARNGVDVYIVCVPYHIKKHGDAFENDTYEYFIEKGYSPINALDKGRKWFDLRTLHPDYVFHSRPYNHFMPRVYRSEIISRYARICNILYAPGFMYGDMMTTIFNWDYFKDVSMYFAFSEIEKDYWNDKFQKGYMEKLQAAYSIGIPMIEGMLSYRTNENDGKMKVMWTPRWSSDPKIGGSNFFNYKEFFLEYAEKTPELELIIRPHPLMFDNFISTGELTKEEAEDYVKRIHQMENVQLNEDKEYLQLLWSTSVLVSDVSSLIWEYVITGRPIVFCPSGIKCDYVDSTDDMLDVCYVVNNQQELQETLDMLRNGKDPLSEKRQEFVSGFIEKHKHASKRIADVLIDNMKKI